MTASRSASQFSTDSLSLSTLPLLCARVTTTFHSASAVLGSGDFRLIVYCTTLHTPRSKPTSQGPSSPLQLSSTRISTPTRFLWALLDSKRNLSTKVMRKDNQIGTVRMRRPTGRNATLVLVSPRDILSILVHTRLGGIRIRSASTRLARCPRNQVARPTHPT